MERILDDVGEEPGNLPLLEFALTELWKERRGGQLLHAAYEAMGAVQGAIARRAEEVFARLTLLEQDAARRVFMQLVRPGEQTQDTRRRTTFAELGEAVRPVVQQLTDARLMVTGHGRAAGEETIEVAHEALIRSWARLQGWLDVDREFLLWRQRLRTDLADWERTRHDEDTLLRGAPLIEAQRWLAERPDDLSLVERRFIQESVALRERLRIARERRRLILGLVGGLLCVIFLALLAWYQRNQALQAKAYAEQAKADAEAGRQIALARQLASQAELAFDNTGTGLVRSVLLGVESLRIFQTVEADQTLRRGLALLTPMVARLAHGDRVEAVAFSPDGKWLATGSKDNTARVWEAATGREVARMAHEDRVEAIVFSPDGTWLATGSSDHTAGVWKAATGQAIIRRRHEDAVDHVAFSPDGAWLATGSYKGKAQMWLWRTEDLLDEACARLPRNLTEVEWGRYLHTEIYRKTCPNLKVTRYYAPMALPTII